MSSCEVLSGKARSFVGKKECVRLWAQHEISDAILGVRSVQNTWKASGQLIAFSIPHYSIPYHSMYKALQEDVNTFEHELSSIIPLLNKVAAYGLPSLMSRSWSRTRHECEARKSTRGSI